MYSEEIFIKLTEDHVRRCYKALVLTDKMLDLYKKRTNKHTMFFPEDLEAEFYKIIEEYLKEGAEDEENQ